MAAGQVLSVEGPAWSLLASAMVPNTIVCLWYTIQLGFSCNKELLNISLFVCVSTYQAYEEEVFKSSEDQTKLEADEINSSVNNSSEGEHQTFFFS